jgi:uncharacterized DUF497 family protein
MKTAAFDWDAGNRAKCAKHGVSAEEIEELFRGAPRIAPDWLHSVNEERLIAVGRTRSGRPLFVAFTLRERTGEMLIRPISARYMHKKEIKAHEKEGS